MTSKMIKDELKGQVVSLKEQGVEPTLAVVLVGGDPASQVYVKHKKKACEYVGIRSLAYELSAETTEEELLELIATLNSKKKMFMVFWYNYHYQSTLMKRKYY